jgi:hypothetical protein
MPFRQKSPPESAKTPVFGRQRPETRFDREARIPFQEIDAAPDQARVSGLRFLEQDFMDQRNAVLGNQRNFADTVSAYIGKKLGAE